MSNLPIGAILIVAAALFGPSFSAAQQPQELVTIGGRVLDARAETPIAGARATVFMNHDGSLVADTATARSDGVFRFELPVMPDRILVWAQNYAPLNIDEPAASVSGIFALNRLEDWTVQIVDSEANPVPNVPVYLQYVTGSDTYAPSWMAQSLGQQQLRTDSEGVFVVRGMIPDADVTGQVQYLGTTHTLLLLKGAVPTWANYSARHREPPQKTMQLMAAAR